MTDETKGQGEQPRIITAADVRRAYELFAEASRKIHAETGVSIGPPDMAGMIGRPAILQQEFEARLAAHLAQLLHDLEKPLFDLYIVLDPGLLFGHGAGQRMKTPEKPGDPASERRADREGWSVGSGMGVSSMFEQLFGQGGLGSNIGHMISPFEFGEGGVIRIVLDGHIVAVRFSGGTEWLPDREGLNGFLSTFGLRVVPIEEQGDPQTGSNGPDAPNPEVHS